MNAYRQQQLRAAALIEQGATAEQVAEVFGWTERAEPEQIETGDKRTLTPRRKCGIIKAIWRHVRRWKKQQEGKTMKKYVVREYRTAPDGSEYETERYTITADELDETRAGLDELTGTAIDRYEIEEI